MVNWRRGWGLSALTIYAFCYICETYVGVMVFQRFGVVVLHRSMVNWRREWGQCGMGICAFCYI